MTETAVPSFKKIRDSIPGSTAPRTLDAAIEFLDQLDGAIDLDDVGLKVYEALAAVIFELRKLNTSLKTLKTELAGNDAGELTTNEEK